MKKFNFFDLKKELLKAVADSENIARSLLVIYNPIINALNYDSTVLPWRVFLNPDDHRYLYDSLYHDSESDLDTFNWNFVLLDIGPSQHCTVPPNEVWYLEENESF